MSTGIIFDLQRFCTEDGPGLRSTVFFKGCQLRCRWCHNPESLSGQPQLGFRAELCCHCGACAALCGGHLLREGRHSLCPESCTACGRCVALCPTGALRLYGRRVTVEDCMDTLLRDRAYYETTGGGVTISGGEPTRQPEFLLALLKACRAEGLHTALDTNGCVDLPLLETLLPYTSLFLVDYKCTEDSLFWTGAEADAILPALGYLQRKNAPVWLRCVSVPGVNDNERHRQAIQELAARFYNIEKLEIRPYHGIGEAKWAELGLSAGYP